MGLELSSSNATLEFLFLYPVKLLNLISKKFLNSIDNQLDCQCESLIRQTPRNINNFIQTNKHY